MRGKVCQILAFQTSGASWKKQQSLWRVTRGKANVIGRVENEERRAEGDQVRDAGMGYIM